MSLANRFTFFRLFLSPVFFIIYNLPARAIWAVPLLWLIFVVSEITDLLDGMAARKRGEVSDFGKLFDPFADTIMQITCFLCFVIDGIFPAILFLLVIYREFGVLFIRNLMLKKGVSLGARFGGKLKTVFYIIAAAVALLAVSVKRFSIFEFLFPYIKTGALIIFIISIIISIISFIDYFIIFWKTKKTFN